MLNITKESRSLLWPENDDANNGLHLFFRFEFFLNVVNRWAGICELNEHDQRT